jgi:glycosyltransferase involved in cell wall biosynthesis
MKKLLAWLQIFYLATIVAHNQKPFVVIIPSYNNAPWCIKNLESVLNQNYTNYRIVIIDDCSTDGQKKLLTDYIKEKKIGNKVTLKTNEDRHYKLHNMYYAVQECKPNEIVLELDGDDFLAHNDVLATFNDIYTTKKVWLVHAYYEDVTLNHNKKWKFIRKGRFCGQTPASLIKARSYRKHWYWSGLRSYYAWLYQKIDKKDLIMIRGQYKGQFFPTSSDRAVMYPMLEMAGDRIYYIPEVLLHRNVYNPINDNKVASTMQRQIERILLRKEKYPLLDNQVDDYTIK